MLRLLALPFTIGLGVLAAFLLVAGVAVLEDVQEGDGPRNDGGPLGLFADGADERDARREATGVGITLVALGLIGLVASVALTIASLSGHRRAPDAPMQQQQQVVVVTDGQARIIQK